MRRKKIVPREGGGFDEVWEDRGPGRVEMDIDFVEDTSDAEIQGHAPLRLVRRGGLAGFNPGELDGFNVRSVF